VQSGSQPILREYLAAGSPVIVHVLTSALANWNFEAIHAFVVTDLNEQFVSVNDPASPSAPTLISRDAFLRAWSATDYLTIVIRPLAK
jgi:ABC-type bacteriocin/lantibiotic exporter with double-glycine peptidase domain